MADKSRIEWTDATWTPIRARRRDTGKVGVHCERVSEGCANCYAASHNKRNLPVHGTGLDFTILNRENVEIFVDAEMLLAPLRWKRPRRIFVCSQTDLFGEFISDEQIGRVLAIMALTPEHTFQVLTKRPERMLSFTSKSATQADHYIWGFSDVRDYFHPKHHDSLLRRQNRVICRSKVLPLPNVWLGVTAESQARADERIPVLLQTPSANRFVSVEPMLGPVDLTRYLVHDVKWDTAGGPNECRHGYAAGIPCRQCTPGLGWVICGGESGAGARPMHPDWARSLRDQCKAAGVPFHFKQWGAWQNGSDEAWQGKIVLNDGRRGETPESFDLDTRNNWPDFRPCQMAFVGKNRAGRLLDGREWSEFPEVYDAR